MLDNIDNKELNEIRTALGGNKNTTVFLNVDCVAPVLAGHVSAPFVYVTAGADAARRAAKIIGNLDLRVAVVSQAADMPIKTDVPVARETELYTAVNRLCNGQTDVLVVAAAAMLSCVPNINDRLQIVCNQNYNRKVFIETLANFGYVKTQMVSEVGEYSVRGDVVDLWPISERNPIRVMFFGDKIEAIKKIDITTYLSCGTLTDYRISPLLTDRWSLATRVQFQTITEALDGIAKSFVFERPREIVEVLTQAEKQNGMRLTSLIEGGLLTKDHAKMFCSPAQLAFDKFTCFGFQGINSNHNLFKSSQVFTLKAAAVPNYYNALSAMTADIVRNARTKKVLIYVGASKALQNYLHEKQADLSNITIIQKELGCSFELPDCKLAVYSMESAPGEEESTTSIFTKNKSAFVLPHVGEVVVHEHHGLGRFLGIKKLTLQDAERDYIVLQYDGGALVYLPPEQTAALSNYSGEPARLSRIGGQDFAQAKQRVRRRLRELSFKLSELYSRRARVKANVYQCDPVSIQQFSGAFQYALTPDQQKAVDDIERDMTGVRIMDRLICGDVGYGKTEVALTAVFRAVCSGFQAAMLCPTTILSVQHYNTAKARLEPFGVHVEVLNRFRTDTEVKKILDGLKSGNIDFIIGTHKLLGNIGFKNLGLLVLDEEQRFGVGHKEKMKQMKSNVDVLTLSATPIPRTLNMALIGIRDISVISSPPVNRFPVITYVCEYSDYLVVDAIERELARDGQTIVLYNDVANIEKFAAQLASKINARVGIIHGQMSERRLEDTIAELYNKQIDVMVASTIIENGVDLTSANTLIVVDSDRLGVAQMHQLRGRVGRANIQAYAYFTYRGGKTLSEVATSRLEAIQSFYASGAGMQIAMKDLHLRGAGSVLGANQSGHMEQIGFDTYCKILEEVSLENRGERVEETPPPETVLDIALDCFIPHTYIENEEERMKVYVAISQIKIADDRRKILDDLTDIYGKLPREVENVVLVGYIRALCKNKNIRLVTFNKNGCVIKFFDMTEQRLRAPTISNLIEYLNSI